MKTSVVFLMAGGLLFAQAPYAPNPTRQSGPVRQGDSTPVYRVTVVARTTKAINYHHRSGSTKIDFRGTPLLPEARGEAKVESKQGVIKIEADMEKLQPATKFGPEYLTYVMWAITPEGRATNIGEVLLDGHKSELNATTDLQSFGLIVTAEPYFAVTQPSDVVVMENFVRRDTTGTIEEVDAKYQLLQRGQYTLNANPAEIKPIRLDPKVPLELYQARNAVQIARWAGAEKYAEDTFLKAVQGLQNAEGYLKSKSGRKPIGTVAREAAQMAEDARIITLKKIEEEQLANERQAAADREARANAEAEAETRRRAQAEAEQKLETERRARAEAERAAAESATRLARREAELAAAAGERTQREADAAGAAALAKQQAAEREKDELRARLLRQLNLILDTRDSARGLIVNMPDVLFDTGRYTLRPAAREKLAKVAGIILAHPGLMLEVEGHTDSVGSDEYNQRLSEQRATSAGEYLAQQGIPATSITTRGFGKTEPVAPNDTAAGRRQNRRVDLVVSGEAIGVPFGSVSTLR
ncbi:MAG: OmpA family protein [Bryobacteraceae bacterium]